MSIIVQSFEHSLALPLGLEWKLTFSSPVATAEFSNFADILSAALSQHHLLGFEIVMLPKAHLTLHSRMSGFRWVFTPLWLSGSWRSFLYSSVYSCHLFLPGGSMVKNLPAKQHMWVQSLGWEDPLEKYMATSSSIFAWEIPWTEEPSRLFETIGFQRVRHSLATKPLPALNCKIHEGRGSVLS